MIVVWNPYMADIFRVALASIIRSLDSMEYGTVEWNSGMMEWAINDPVPIFTHSCANWACTPCTCYWRTISINISAKCKLCHGFTNYILKEKKRVHVLCIAIATCGSVTLTAMQWHLKTCDSYWNIDRFHWTLAWSTQYSGELRKYGQ